MQTIVRLQRARGNIWKVFIADDGYTREKQNDKARSKFQRKERSEKLKQRFSTFFRRKFTCNFLSADKRFVILGEKCVNKVGNIEIAVPSLRGTIFRTFSQRHYCFQSMTFHVFVYLISCN